LRTNGQSYIISAFIQTTVRTDIDKIDSASDPDQEYTYLMGSETIDSASDPDQEYIYDSASDPDQEYIYLTSSSDADQEYIYFMKSLHPLQGIQVLKKCLILVEKPYVTP